MNTLIAAAVAALFAVPAAAQVAGKPVGTFTPPSCGEPGQALERSFELTLPKAPAPMTLIYAGCSEEDRNDYLPGYTERYYKGSDGYGVVLVTDHGDGAMPQGDPDITEVLVSKGKDWSAQMGTFDNAKLVSGDAVSAEGYSLRAKVKPVAPAVPACEAKLPKPVYGPNTLWLLTKTKAYYYREDCDICAELDSCDLASGAIKPEIEAHEVDCSDLASYKKGADVVYDYCAK